MGTSRAVRATFALFFFCTVWLHACFSPKQPLTYILLLTMRALPLLSCSATDNFLSKVCSGFQLWGLKYGACLFVYTAWGLLPWEGACRSQLGTCHGECRRLLPM